MSHVEYFQPRRRLELMDKTEFPTTRDDRAKIYLHCMLECHARIESANIVLSSDLKPLFKNEFCWLQLRHICEVMAMGCITAQGDFETYRDFSTSHSPPKIFRQLIKLNQHFFPQPVKLGENEDGIKTIEWNQKPEAINQSEVEKLWSVSGNQLHRLSAKKYLKTTMQPPESVTIVQNHLIKIVRLLESHIIPIGDADYGKSMTALIVYLSDGNGKFKADFMDFDGVDGTARINSFISGSLE